VTSDGSVGAGIWVFSMIVREISLFLILQGVSFFCVLVQARRLGGPSFSFFSIPGLLPVGSRLSWGVLGMEVNFLLEPPFFLLQVSRNLVKLPAIYSPLHGPRPPGLPCAFSPFSRPPSLPPRLCWWDVFPCSVVARSEKMAAQFW